MCSCTEARTQCSLNQTVWPTLSHFSLLTQTHPKSPSQLRDLFFILFHAKQTLSWTNTGPPRVVMQICAAYDLCQQRSIWGPVYYGVDGLPRGPKSKWHHLGVIYLKPIGIYKFGGNILASLKHS